MDIEEFPKLKGREEITKKTLNIGENISKYSADVLKLNVSHDAAYWNVRQQLKQMKVSHERQHINMVELQMQNETVSGQYQEELRQRPEVLNKIHSTREMCDVIETSAERLKQTLLRCRADQTSISAAFNNSAQFIQELKDSHRRSEVKYLQQISSLQETAKLTEEHQTRVIELVEQLSQANEKLRTELNDAKNKLANANSQLAKKEEDLKRDITKMNSEIHMQMEDAKNAIQTKEKSLKDAVDSNAELRNAINNQEEFCKRLLDHKNELEEKIAVLEEEKISALEQIEGLRIDLEQVHVSDENAKKVINDFNVRAEVMRNQLEEKEDVVNNFISEIEKLKSQINAIKEKNKNLIEALKKAEEDGNSSRLRVQQLVDETTTLRTIVEGKIANYDNYKVSMDLITRELDETVKQQKQELNKKASTAAEMMTDLHNNMNRANILQSALKLSNEQLEETIKIAKEEGIKILQLEAYINDKNIELSSRTEMMQVLKNEKELLQKKITNMQETIDNARDHLSVQSPRLRTCIENADDNAVAMTPTREVPERSPLFSPSPKFAVAFENPLSSEGQIDTLYDFHSDSNADDSCSIDKYLLTRRLKEKKRRPVRRSAFKRSRDSSPPKMQTKTVPEQRPKAMQKRKTYKSRQYELIPK